MASNGFFSVDSMNSCKQLYSDVSSNFYDCENYSNTELSFTVPDSNSPETMEIHENTSETPDLLYDIPNVESFILSTEKDSFYESLFSGINKDKRTKNTVLTSKSNKRIKRWLKDEDRKLIHIILELQKKNQSIKDELNGNIESNKDTRNIWNFIKNILHTSRTLTFLQDRYNRLIRNQKLNTKEMVLMADKYDTISVETFMVIFPGKTVDTLNKLISEFEGKQKLSKKISGVTYHEKCSFGKFSPNF